MATPYKINIPMYEGPLDLLLDLIKKQEMNIHDIQIATITSQYLDYLHKLEELNVDVSADFIYMAATLIYIKSKMLLPPDPLASRKSRPPIRGRSWSNVSSSTKSSRTPRSSCTRNSRSKRTSGPSRTSRFTTTKARKANWLSLLWTW